MKSTLLLLAIFSSLNAFAETEEVRFHAEIHKRADPAKVLVIGYSYDRPSLFAKKEKKAALDLAQKSDLKNCSFVEDNGEKVQDFFYGKIVFLECDAPAAQ